jgi:hypothetical protein
VGKLGVGFEAPLEALVVVGLGALADVSDGREGRDGQEVASVETRFIGTFLASRDDSDGVVPNMLSVATQSALVVAQTSLAVETLTTHLTTLVKCRCYGEDESERNLRKCVVVDKRKFEHFCLTFSRT